jgi:hypothetical protein
VVALAPGGGGRPKPGILPATLTFAWGRAVPTLYLAAEDDVMTPLDGVRELLARTPSPSRMAVLRKADHLHFMDGVEDEHEAARATPWPGALAWIPREMRPIAELCSGEEAHTFARGLAAAHFDATLRGGEDARRLLDGEVEAELRGRGVGGYSFRNE